MKKLAIIGIFVLLYGITFGQKVKKDMTVGVHVLTIKLNPDYTMEQAQDFIMNTYIPAWEKHHPGVKSLFTKSIRGENKDSYGWINVVESLETLRKYANDDGSSTELQKSIQEKLKPEIEERDRIFKKFKSKYNTWLIL